MDDFKLYSTSRFNVYLSSECYYLKSNLLHLVQKWIKGKFNTNNFKFEDQTSYQQPGYSSVLVTSAQFFDVNVPG